MGWVGELLSVVLYVELVESWRAKTQKNTVLSSPGLKITKYRLTTSRV